MPSFSAKSVEVLETVDERLQVIAYTAIKFIDFVVVEGVRGEDAQNAAYAKGLSKVKWPHGKHNVMKKGDKAKAFDLAPYPIDWSDKAAAQQRFVLLAGFMLCIAAQKGIRIRWGGDWNSNMDTRDEKFRDLPHFELVDD